MRVNCVVVHECAVSRRYINVCNSDVFSVVNMYLDHLKFDVVCINGGGYICCIECYVVYNVCDKPTHTLCNLCCCCSPFSPCSFQSGSLASR